MKISVEIRDEKEEVEEGESVALIIMKGNAKTIEKIQALLKEAGFTLQ